MSEKLSTELPWSIDETSVADVVSAIQRWDVPDGAEVSLESGNFAVADLVTTGGAEPSRSTRLGLAYREPNDPLGAWTVFTLEVPIAPFNDLSLKDQQSGENAQNRRFRFDPEEVDRGRINFEDADEIALVVVGPDTIDGAASQFSIDMEFSNQ
jgi:hypothetical protein